MKTRLILLSILLNFSSCRDFYVGMFKKNDFLVAQDTLYRERTPFRFTYAKYGRLFNCPITYFRVVDRLGVGRGPRVQITRGGLQKKYLTLRIVSLYNQPISVNIYVGCANNIQSTTTTTTTTTEKAEEKVEQKEDDKEKEKEEEKVEGNEEAKEEGKKEGEGETTVADANAETTAAGDETTSPAE